MEVLNVFGHLQGERAESIKLTFFICKLFSTCSSAEKLETCLRQTWKRRKQVKGWQKTDQTGANPATRQMAKGRGAALYFMAQEYHDVALGRKPLERLWRNWHDPPSRQHGSTRFLLYREKAVGTIKFSRYIDITVVSWLTVSTWGGEFLTEDLQIVNTLYTMTKLLLWAPLLYYCEHVLWQRS